MIPEAAVEAAAKDLADINGYAWCETTPEIYRTQARRILEAVAPYLKAEALREAAVVAYRGEGGSCDDGECDDWSAWLRARAEGMERQCHLTHGHPDPHYTCLGQAGHQ